MMRLNTMMAQVVGLLLVAVMLGGCGVSTDPGPPPPTSDVPPEQLLVDVDWLEARLEDESVQIVDMRSPSEFEQGHVPGAVNLPVNRISTTVNGVPMELDEELVAESLSAVGLRPEATVVVVDNLGMMDAARLFWTLEYVGHGDVRILDGGWNAWADGRRTIQPGLADPAPSGYPIRPRPSLLMDAEEIQGRLQDENLVIVDARAPEEYIGEVNLAERGGHIPGAILFTWSDALTGGDVIPAWQNGWRDELTDPDVERFRPREDLERLVASAGIEPGAEIVTYCQTLWRGAHVYFLLRYLGYDNVSGYDGSWAEWGNRQDLPVAVGPEPWPTPLGP